MIEGKLARHTSNNSTFKNPKHKVKQSDINDSFLMGIRWSRIVEQLQSNDLRAMVSILEENTDLDQEKIEWMHPLALAAQDNTEDNPTWFQAMNGPHKEEYWKACTKEHEALLHKETWDVVKKKPWMNVLPSTWAFKCKRYPDGSIRKFKARFCAQGDKQIEGVVQ